MIFVHSQSNDCDHDSCEFNVMKSEIRPRFMTFFTILVGAITMIYPRGSLAATPLHKDSMLLARCEFIYAYNAQLMQLKNNIGAAQNIVRRASLVSTANMMLNEEGGVIAGWKIEKFNSVRAPLKRQLDSKEVSAIDAATDCDRTAIPIASATRNNSTTLWGKSFDELQDMFSSKFKNSIGLP